ncbi:hypothetical protein FXO37_36610 [Capsicum annuum]|nr:hypothetical protein FXO37_36610 [Capsicum annuum]
MPKKKKGKKRSFSHRTLCHCQPSQHPKSQQTPHATNLGRASQIAEKMPLLATMSVSQIPSQRKQWKAYRGRGSIMASADKPRQLQISSICSWLLLWFGRSISICTAASVTPLQNLKDKSVNALAAVAMVKITASVILGM